MIDIHDGGPREFSTSLPVSVYVWRSRFEHGNGTYCLGNNGQQTQVILVTSGPLISDTILVSKLTTNH